MINKLRFALGRKFIVNELKYFAIKYQNGIDEAKDIGTRMVYNRKLETVKEIAERFQIGEGEIGL